MKELRPYTLIADTEEQAEMLRKLNPGPVYARHPVPKVDHQAATILMGGERDETLFKTLFGFDF